MITGQIETRKANHFESLDDIANQECGPGAGRMHAGNLLAAPITRIALVTILRHPRLKITASALRAGLER